jgi:cell fate (sporulation/competence/biofilm development) regulator YlbF (YheA/YmcA/DUF963 family)
MPTTTEETAIVQKTLELCQTILSQPQFHTLRRDIDTFLADDAAKTQYRLVIEKGELLQHKQQTATPITQQEIEEFEAHRQTLVANPVARGFLDAQHEIHRVQETVGQYVAKTFELGRLPTTEDFSSDSCGPTCGCGH